MKTMNHTQQLAKDLGIGEGVKLRLTEEHRALLEQGNVQASYPYRLYEMPFIFLEDSDGLFTAHSKLEILAGEFPGDIKQFVRETLI